MKTMLKKSRIPRSCLVAILVICPAVLLCGSKVFASDKNGIDQKRLSKALGQFDANQRDTVVIRFLKEMAGKRDCPYCTIGNVMLSIALKSEIDTFKEATRYAVAAVTSAKSATKEQVRAFSIKPTIEYFRMMEPTKKQITFLQHNRAFLLPYAGVVFRHAELFHLLGSRNLLYEANACFKVFNQYFYADEPEIRRMSDAIQLWLVELTKDLPME